MLSHIWTANDALPMRARLRTGASFVGCTAVARERAETAAASPVVASPVVANPVVASPVVANTAATGPVVAGLRPQASASAVSFGNAAHAAGQAKSALQQRTSQKKYARTTRIAALGGGAMGPHPARDPV
jgi:hypothetical protein